MAKKQNGPQREELKAATAPDPRKLVETVVGASPEEPANEPPKESAQSAIEAAVDKGDKVVSSGGFKTAFDKSPAKAPNTITKPELDRLANRTANSDKHTVIDLDKAVAEVKAENEALKALKKERRPAGSKIVRELREGDPVGKKTCGYCGHRVSLDKMDRKKELCEVCAS
jgi:hypothetical protein